MYLNLKSEIIHYLCGATVGRLAASPLLRAQRKVRATQSTMFPNGKLSARAGLRNRKQPPSVHFSGGRGVRVKRRGKSPPPAWQQAGPYDPWVARSCTPATSGWLARCRGVDRWRRVATSARDKWQAPCPQGRAQNPAYRPAVVLFTPIPLKGACVSGGIAWTPPLGGRVAYEKTDRLLRLGVQLRAVRHLAHHGA